MAKQRYSVYIPDDGHREFPTRKEALEYAHKVLANADGGEGWPDDMDRLGVYVSDADASWEAGDIEWQPLLTAREKPGSKLWKRECPEKVDNHDDCLECEGSWYVDQHGEPWTGDPDWQYIVAFEFPPAKSWLQRATAAITRKPSKKAS